MYFSHPFLLFSPTATNNSPSRMVKFDMPSFDSQNSEEVPSSLTKTVEERSVEERSVECQAGGDLADVEFWLKLTKLLESLQRLETNTRTGDRAVLGTFSLDRLHSEGHRWRNILRKSVSNVLRIHDTICEHSQLVADDSGGEEEVTCPLIQFDLRDSEVQTEVSLNTHTNLFRDAQMQTESEKAESLGNQHTVEVQDGGKEVKCPLSRSCPHLDVILSEEIDSDFPPLREDTFTFDLEQINHCIMSKETDIVDDFVIL